MIAMIFAAGMGTRLRPLTDTRPKALISVAGKPMLEHIILRLKAAGFNELVINVHHFADQILEFLEENDCFGTQMLVSDETEQLLDTGGGLEKAGHLLRSFCYEEVLQTLINPVDQSYDKTKTNEEVIKLVTNALEEKCFLLHNVDILSNCDLKALAYHHQFHAPDIKATLLVSKRKTSRYLLFDKDDLLRGWINKDTMETKPENFIYEEGKYREYAYSGIQVISPYLFNYLPKGKYSIIDFYLSMCHKMRIQCYAQDNLQVIDVGKPDTLEKAEDFLNRL